MLIDYFVQKINENNKNFIPKVILDIGSRDLEQSLEFNKVYPNASIFAFEPNPEQYNICLQKINNNIKLFNLAISSVNEERDFYLTKGNIGASSLLKPIDIPFAFNNIVENIKVKSISLDKWMEENNVYDIDIIWMDVQGVELEVLKTIKKEYLNKIKYIHCEASELPYYENHQLKKDLENFFIENNFNIYFHKPHYHPYDEGDLIAINERIKYD